MRACAALAVAVAGLSAGALGACSGDSEGGDPPLSAADSTFAEALAEIHLADARADLFGDSLGTAAESLRTAALDAHGLDAATFDRTLDEITADPERTGAVYDAVTRRLSREAYGTSVGAQAMEPAAPDP